MKNKRDIGLFGNVRIMMVNHYTWKRAVSGRNKWKFYDIYGRLNTEYQVYYFLKNGNIAHTISRDNTNSESFFTLYDVNDSGFISESYSIQKGFQSSFKEHSINSRLAYIEQSISYNKHSEKYNYNSDNKLVSSIVLLDNEAYEESFYFYDKNGYVIKQIIENRINVSRDYIYIFTNDENGNKIEESCYVRNKDAIEELGDLFERRSFIWNDLGCIEERVFLKFGRRVNNTTKWVYNNAGNLIEKVIEEDESNGEDKRRNLEYYCYDEFDNLIEEKKINTKGAVYYHIRNKYEYDNFNNWIVCVKTFNRKKVEIVNREIEYY